MQKRIIFIVLVLCQGFFVYSQSKEKPNVVFIIADDLTSTALACYGNEQVKTPNIDKLAQNGMLFEQAYCQFPVCGASRASFMSGMYPQAIKVQGNGPAQNFTELLGNRKSMSQNFKDQGYFTARVSKIYHMKVPGDITAGVDGPDHEASWTERCNVQGGEWHSKGVYENIGRGKLKRDDLTKHYDLGFGGAFVSVKTEGIGSDQPDYKAASKAIEIINKERGKPFFLAVGLVRPHVPLVAPQSYFDMYPPKTLAIADFFKEDLDDIPVAGRSVRSSKRFGVESKEKQQDVLAAYYASVTFMDAQVGRIVKALATKGILDNTIVVFTSDHGWHLGEHSFWQKMSIHEESAKVPIIVKAPGKKTGVTSASLVEMIDFYPTLASLCGLDVPKHIQGKSFVKILDNPSSTIRTTAYCNKEKSHLLRTDRWAYLTHSDGVELYDMIKDPKQITNLSKDLKYASIVKGFSVELKKKLKAISNPK